jgi:hypothetical protein
MSNSKLVILGIFCLALGWSIWFWNVTSPGTWAQWSAQQFAPDATATIPEAINDGRAQALAQQATDSNGGPLPNYPDRQLTFYPGGADSGAPADSDFRFSYFYLGATRQAVQAACIEAGGTIEGIWSDSIANPPGFPVCYFTSDTYTDGYYPVYWPAQ